MENSVFLLFFFIIYNFVITWIFVYSYFKREKYVKEKENYIEELLNELAKARKKWYSIVEEEAWKRF